MPQLLVPRQYLSREAAKLTSLASVSLGIHTVQLLWIHTISSITAFQGGRLPAYKIQFWASEFAFLPKSRLNTNTDNVLGGFYTTFCKLLNKPWISRLLCSSGERIFFF